MNFAGSDFIHTPGAEYDTLQKVTTEASGKPKKQMTRKKSRKMTSDAQDQSSPLDEDVFAQYQAKFQDLISKL